MWSISPIKGEAEKGHYYLSILEQKRSQNSSLLYEQASLMILAV